MLRASRRRFLQAAGGVAAAAAGFAVCRFIYSGGAVVFNPQLEALIAEGNFSAGLGEKVLQDEALRSGTTFDALHTEVMNGLSERGPDLRGEIGKKVERDFAERRICRIDGWQLSATECRLAALAFLFQESGGHIDAPVDGDDGPISGLPEMPIAELENWGPRFSTVGDGFNVQPSGDSALWFLFLEMDQQPYEIYFGGHPLRTSVVSGRNLITATVTKRLVRQLASKPDEIPVHLVNSVQGNKQLLGHFSVRPKGVEPRHGDLGQGDLQGTP